jgi:hypothetical protein
MRHRSASTDEPDLVPVVEVNDDDKCTAVGLAHEDEAILADRMKLIGNGER